MRVRPCCLLVLLTVIGCKTTPHDTQPGVAVRLVGKIQPSTQTPSLGEDLVVDYWISSLGTRPATVQIEDGSQDPEAAFQGYTFNAVLASNPKAPMEPIFLGKPLHGRHTLDPQQPVRFQRIRWRARRPGNYKLTFIIEWKKGEIIAFEPVTVQVRGRRLPTEKSPVEVRPEVANQTRQLIAELSLHLSDKAWRKRAEIKVRIRKIGAPATIPLIEYLGDSREAVRMQVTVLMIEFGRQAIPALLNGCTHENALVRYRSVYALGKILEAVIGTRARQEVSNATHATLSRLASRDPDLNVRYVAVDMLASRFTTRESVPVLLDALADPELAIRKACNRWLKKLSASDVGYEPAASVDERKAAIKRWRKYWGPKLQ